MNETTSNAESLNIRYMEIAKPDTAANISGRTLCEIYDDMRQCCKTGNYSYLPGLIEEAQYRANRMEDRLNVVHGFEDMMQKRNEIREAIKKANKVLPKEERLSTWEWDW